MMLPVMDISIYDIYQQDSMSTALSSIQGRVCQTLFTMYSARFSVSDYTGRQSRRQMDAQRQTLESPSPASEQNLVDAEESPPANFCCSTMNG